MKKSFTILALLIILQSGAFCQDFYDINTIQKIEIVFTDANWDYRLDTAYAGSEGYILAKTVTINGTVFDSVGVKYKGNSTYNANQKKNPFHIELDTYKNQDYQGFTDIKMSNVAKDPTYVREVLSYSILRNYMDAPLSNYANVYVNGSLIGLYSSSESISKKFVDKYFYSKDKTFVKCNPISGAGPGSSAFPNLVYLGTDSSAYYAAYEMKSDYGWKELISLCNTLSNNTSEIEKILDVDRALWMLAFNNVLVNMDSYSGGFAQNYYLYKDGTGRFNPIVWDLNESFGTFSMTGTINLNTTASKQQLTHLLHVNDAAWPLIQKLLAVPRYKRMYIAHMKTMVQENFSNGTYYTTAQNMQSIVNSAVAADPNKFFTYAQYQSNLTTDISGGMSNTPGIKNLMDARATWLLAQSDFTATAPTISNVKTSNTAPALNSNLFITCAASNATDVMLAYRYSNQNAFVKVPMYDDGAHGDGASGDKVYGTEVKMSSASMEYYFYADNSAAGIFSPLRAEHEFYSLFATISTIQKGELVINEFMADNGTTQADLDGQYDDWIELYNNTSNTLSLANLYMSDSYTSTQKWKFPNTTVIAPKGYLIVWADDDATQSGLHAAFKLSSSGEKVILSYADGTVVDSITFDAQTKDISYLRCPNGTGSFRANSPSFGTENCLTSAAEDIENNELAIYPNPGTGLFYIQNTGEWIKNIKVYNATGHQIINLNDLANETLDIDITSNAPGMYFIRINDQITKKIIKQ
ncbi:MAG: CotH kinase family protein [Saprospiraceae bacterium]